jgi:hypothetical protein
MRLLNLECFFNRILIEFIHDAIGRLAVKG